MIVSDWKATKCGSALFLGSGPLRAESTWFMHCWRKGLQHPNTATAAGGAQKEPHLQKPETLDGAVRVEDVQGPAQHCVQGRVDT